MPREFYEPWATNADSYCNHERARSKASTQAWAMPLDCSEYGISYDKSNHRNAEGPASQYGTDADFGFINANDQKAAVAACEKKTKKRCFVYDQNGGKCSQK